MKKIEKMRKQLSILMVLFFGITNLTSQYALADSNTNANILGGIEHYNAVIFGDFTPSKAETEGALAIKGNLNVEESYTVGGVNANPTGWSIGEGKIDDNGPTFALGGDIADKSKIPNIGYKQSRVNDVIVTDGSNASSRFPNWMALKSISKSEFTTEFDKLRQQVNAVMSKASHFTPDTISGEQASEPFKFMKSKENAKILVNSINRDVAQLNIDKDFDIPNLDNTDFLIIYSNAETIDFKGSLTYDGTSVDDTKQYSATDANTPIKKIAPKILYVFPNAKTINVTSRDGIKGSIFAPEAILTISGITLNGQMFLKNAIQKGGTEFHNFVMHWDNWNNTPDPKLIPSKGSIKLVKKADNNTTLLPNAVFQLKNSSGVVIKNISSTDGNYITDSNGEINILNLDLGNYTLTEIIAPDGYVNNNQVINFDLTEATKDVTEVAINNKIKTAVITLTKVDKDSKKTLEGVKFELHKDDGQAGMEGTLVQDNLTTGVDGILKTNPVPLGRYYLKETNTLDGYTLLANRIPADLSNLNDGGVLNLNNIENEKTKIKVQIKKVDAISQNTTLPGAVFRLWNADNNQEVNPNQIYTTDSSGLSEEIILTRGNYYFEEIIAPNGYKRAGKQATFSITGKEKEKVIQTILNVKEDSPKLGTLKITKTGNINGEKLEGVKFNLLDSNSDKANVIANLITDVNGIAWTVNLPIGKYYLKETETKVGYELSKDYIEVNITSETLNVEKNIENKVILGTAQLLKTDKYTGKPLQGAEFKIVKEDNSEIGTYISNEQGIVLAELKPGKYSFVETKAPEGYKLDKTPKSFEIKLGEQSKVVYVGNLENELIKGSVTLTKLDEESNSIKLDGAEFRLFRADGTEVSDNVYVTKNGGVVTVSELPIGSYHFTEIKAPENYELDNKTKWKFDIEKEDNYSARLATVEAKNKKKPIIEIPKDEDITEIEIPEEPIPLGTAKTDEVEIPDDSIAEGQAKIDEPDTIKLPKTGSNVDTSNLIIIGLISIMLGGVFLIKKKK